MVSIAETTIDIKSYRIRLKYLIDKFLSNRQYDETDIDFYVLMQDITHDILNDFEIIGLGYYYEDIISNRNISHPPQISLETSNPMFDDIYSYLVLHYYDVIGAQIEFNRF